MPWSPRRLVLMEIQKGGVSPARSESSKYTWLLIYHSQPHLNFQIIGLPASKATTCLQQDKALYVRGRFKEVLDKYAQAIEINPSFTLIFNEKVYIFFL